MKNITLSALIALMTVTIYAQDWTKTIDQPIELGQVTWMRDYDKALAASKSQGLPVFIFFQEVPGCHTCSTFGNQVMSHPLIVEAVETHFVPLLIHNNKSGADADVLKKYKEPSWNNPVIRIVDQNGKDIVKRHSGAYDPAQVVETIQNAMLASNQIVPTYIDLLATELDPHKEEAVLSMYCFWTGEREIGALDGVESTQAGYMNGREVVKVIYDPNEISYGDLVSEASKAKCADAVFTNDTDEKTTAWKNKVRSQDTSKYRVDSDDKYYLSRTDYSQVPMLAIQATKANTMVTKRQIPTDILSPRQIEILERAQAGTLKKRNRAKGDFKEEWEMLRAE